MWPPGSGEGLPGDLSCTEMHTWLSAHAEAATMDELTLYDGTAWAQGGVRAGTPHLTGGRMPCHVLGDPM